MTLETVGGGAADKQHPVGKDSRPVAGAGAGTGSEHGGFADEREGRLCFFFFYYLNFFSLTVDTQYHTRLRCIT